jgi:lactaldehyde reductase
VDAVQKLSLTVGIPANLKGIVKEEDLDMLADQVINDACFPGNPRETSKEDVIAIYRSLM